MPVRRRLVVEGLVQGVFYRASCERRARAVGLAGWARNLPDGRVEVVLEGPAEAVAVVERWCHGGPRQAHVTSVSATDEAPEGLTGFVAR